VRLAGVEIPQKGVNYRLTVYLASRKLSDVAEMSEQLLIAEVQRRLTSTYAHLPPDEISAAIASAYTRFDQSRIRDLFRCSSSAAPAPSWPS
jgi:DNA-directed RNA polymerase specialized sigma24 family protein